MKTKGNWVIKTSGGLYWCGANLFDEQIRKAQIYHWKEKAEEQAVWIWKRNKISEDITWEVIAVVEPKELKDTQAEWIKIERDIGRGHVLTKYQCSACGVFLACKANFCPNCGKQMTNALTEDDNE
jgi:ribosomal protein S27AE